MNRLFPMCPACLWVWALLNGPCLIATNGNMKMAVQEDEEEENQATSSTKRGDERDMNEKR